MKRIVTWAIAALLVVSLGGRLAAETIHIDLNYNFNGIWNNVPEYSEHMDIAEGGHEVAGFRSISDRALNGVPSHAVLDNYSMMDGSNVLDTVHLGERVFDPTPYGNEYGIQPNWLADANQTGSQTTSIDPSILLDASSSAGFIYHITNGGGNFDVRFGFESGDDVVATLSGADWWGGNGTPSGAFGNFPGMGHVDDPKESESLGLWEGIIDLSAQAGRRLTSISFENRSNSSSHVGIYAANVEGTIPEPGTLALALIGLAFGCCRRT